MVELTPQPRCVCLLSCHALPPFGPTSCADSPARHGWNLGVYSFVPWAEESSWAYFGWCSDMLIVCFLCYLQAFPTDFVPESHTWKQCSRALGPDCLCSDSRFIQVAGKLCDPEQTAQPLCPQFFHLWNGKNNTTQFIQLLWGYNVEYNEPGHTGCATESVGVHGSSSSCC